LSVRVSTTEEKPGALREHDRLSRNCHATRGKWWQFANKKGRVKEKMSCQGSSQVTDFASLASALARFGKVGREATNQKVESSSPSGRTTSKTYPLFHLRCSHCGFQSCFRASSFIGRSLRNKSSKDMAFPHPQSGKEHYRNDDKSNTGRVLWNFFKRTINVTEYGNAKDNMNPAKNRPFGGFFHD